MNLILTKTSTFGGYIKIENEFYISTLFRSRVITTDYCSFCTYQFSFSLKYSCHDWKVALIIGYLCFFYHSWSNISELIFALD